jgi:molybdate transport system substrate-binding protein
MSIRLAAAGAVLLLLAGRPVQTPILTVSAATSLSDVLEEIVKTYAAAGGAAVRLNLGGSNTLARQIVNGAPADLFISADDAQMNVVQEAGTLVPGTRVNLVANQLAVLAPADRAAFVREHFLEAPPEIRRLAMGDPAAVPAGVYARQYLESKGVWKQYQSRVVPSVNVRAALVALETGGADAAIVYATDVAVARRATVAFLVPPDQASPIVYPAAVLKSSRHAEEARRLLAFLRGPEAAAIFARHKFIPLAGK